MHETRLLHDPAGYTVMSLTLEDGLRHGPCTVFHPADSGETPRPRILMHFLHDRIHGPMTVLDLEGHTLCTTGWSENLKHGTEEVFHPEHHTLMCRTLFCRGLREGECTWFSADGTVHAVEIWKKGVRVDGPRFLLSNPLKG